MNREELIEAVLNDPEALWAVRTSNVRVAGRWETAHSETRKVVVHDGVWRLNPEGKDVAVVYPSPKPQAPDFWEFADHYDEDGEPKYLREEQYEWAVADYEKEKAAWKPWSYRISCQLNWPQSAHAKGFAATKEEAMEFADEVLRASQVMLVP
jgi:hypothetical protein